MNKELKNCPICGSHKGKQTWDTRYGLERELTYECFNCRYKEQEDKLCPICKKLLTQWEYFYVCSPCKKAFTYSLQHMTNVDVVP